MSSTDSTADDLTRLSDDELVNRLEANTRRVNVWEDHGDELVVRRASWMTDRQWQVIGDALTARGWQRG